MGTSRVVVPQSKQIPLSGGDWILVRTKLTVGERHDSYEQMYLRHPDGTFVVNAEGRLVVGPANTRIATILAYLLDWSLTAPDGEPLAIRGAPADEIRSMLRSLDEASFEEIADAIGAHERAIAKEQAAQKKTRSAKPASDPTSPSLSAPDGPSTRSEPLM
jgi:hypothetical protein